MSSASAAKVFLVGAGPGDPGLITVKAASLLASADAVVYDYLVHPGLLDRCRDDCERICVGKKAGFHSVPQAEIQQILLRLARAGKQVVRLKGGDPFIYGRGGEEALALAQAGLPFEVVPGVTAAAAASAYAGIPLTHRNTSSSVIFLTGHEDPEKKELAVDWASFAKLDATLCIYMGMGRMEEILRRLLAGGLRPETPAAVVQWASLPRQRSLLATAGTLVEETSRAGLAAPAVVLIGGVTDRMREIGWYEALPLFGRRIAVTRNRETSGGLGERLAALGAEVLEIPLVSISPDPNPEIAEEVFSEFWGYEWIVFTSANGVRGFFDQFFQRFSDIRALGGIRFAAIGRATAKAIEEHRVAVELMPELSTAEGLADALAATDSLDSAKVLVITGSRNRDVLVNRLHEARAIVDQFPVYRTDLADIREHPAAEDFRRGGADLIAFTSSSAVESFIQQAPRLKIADGGRHPKAASLGPVTSEKLRASGIPLAVESPEASLDALASAICRHFAQT